MFMLGNEAVARGAVEAGVQVAAAYPGTPSTEITETLLNLPGEQDMYVEWSVNEKVAFEVALAASICGVRALAVMKHVGVNVAHDALAMAGYIGARGGLVLVSADDPGQWSSQSEQDNRYIAEGSQRYDGGGFQTIRGIRPALHAAVGDPHRSCQRGCDPG
jgi:indolepyruvate ferredoxin oxidoreductase alpha subunit